MGTPKITYACAAFLHDRKNFKENVELRMTGGFVDIQNVKIFVNIVGLEICIFQIFFVNL